MTQAGVANAPPRKRQRPSTRALAGAAVLAAVVIYVGACSVVANNRSGAFDAVKTGDTESAVISRFGTQPSAREQQGKLFARYASRPCSDPCVQRLWFENRLAFDTEAWSVEVDRNGQVVEKAHWVSP